MRYNYACMYWDGAYVDVVIQGTLAEEGMVREGGTEREGGSKKEGGREGGRE